MSKSLRLFGVLSSNGRSPVAPPGVQLIWLRSLAAAVEPAEPGRDERPDVGRYRAVVEALFASDAVLPAPVGTTFRSEQVLQRWLDVHFVALSDALAWVEHRVAARVHLRASDAPQEIVADVARQLSGRAVATLALPGAVDGRISTAYLVEREVWPGFVAAVSQVNERHAGLRAEATGPWPPYDFVRLQLSP